MARQPVFGAGVRPELSRVDYSGIERGGAAMGRGFAALGTAAADAVTTLKQHRQEDKRLTKIGEALFEDDPDTLDAFLGASRAEKEGMLNALTMDHALRMQVEEQRQGAAQSDLMEGQVGDMGRERELRGIRGAAFADVVERGESDPSVVDARMWDLFQEGDVEGALKLWELVPQAEPGTFASLQEGKAALEASGMKGEVIMGKDGRFRVQGRVEALPEPERTNFEKDLDAIEREREAAGLDPLPPDVRAEAIQEYVNRRAAGSSSEDALRLVSAQMMAKMQGLPIPQSADERSFRFPPVRDEPPAPPPVEEPKEEVDDRGFIRRGIDRLRDRVQGGGDDEPEGRDRGRGDGEELSEEEIRRRRERRLDDILERSSR